MLYVYSGAMGVKRASFSSSTTKHWSLISIPWLTCLVSGMLDLHGFFNTSVDVEPSFPAGGPSASSKRAGTTLASLNLTLYRCCARINASLYRLLSCVVPLYLIRFFLLVVKCFFVDILLSSPAPYSKFRANGLYKYHDVRWRWILQLIMRWDMYFPSVCSRSRDPNISVLTWTGRISRCCMWCMTLFDNITGSLTPWIVPSARSL